MVDQTVPRAKVLAELDLLLSHFPDSPYRRQARADVKVLTSMMADESHRKPLTASALIKLPLQPRMEELVWQLKDQSFRAGREAMFGMFADGTPADRLIDHEKDAVPLLIQALNDQRFTRAGFRRYKEDWGGRYHVLRVRDVAVKCLSRIAGFDFADHEKSFDAGYDLPVDNPVQAALVATRIRTWWRDIHSQGESKTWADLVSLGGDRAASLAGELARKYPAAAVQPMRMALSKPTSESNFQLLVSALSYLGPQASLPIAVPLMSHAETLIDRVRAAEVVATFDPDRATRAMALEVPRFFTGSTSPEHPSPIGEDACCKFLAASQRKVAVDALRASIRKMSVVHRWNVIFALSPGRPLDSKIKPPSLPERLAFDHALEAFLGVELTDREFQAGTGISSSGDTGEVSLQDPRPCDFAAFVLARRWPKKFTFKNGLSHAELDALCDRDLALIKGAR